MSMLVLHVGLHKTGSTSIQNSLKGYSASGIKYLDLGPPNHSVPIRVAFTDNPHPETEGVHARVGRTAEELAEMRQGTLERIRKQLSSKGIDKFVISGEGITQLSVGSLLELKALLSTYVDPIRVFAYVRDPAGFAISDFQQRIKAGYAGYELGKPNYRFRLEKFPQVFGRENFSVKVFSREGLKGGSVVTDFCDLWGIPFDPKNEVRANESLSDAAVKLLHLFNRQGVRSKGTPSLARGRQRMIRSLARHFDGKFNPPAEIRAAAFDAADVQWLREELGIAFEMPSATAPKRPAEFRRFLEAIDEETVASYRELLRQGKVATQEGDSTIDLLNRHFEACVAQGDSPAEKMKRLLRRNNAEREVDV